MAAMATTDTFTSSEENYTCIYILYNKHLLDFVFNFFITLRTGISERKAFG